MCNTVTVNTCTKYCIKECPYFEIESNTFFSDNIGHTFYSCAYLDICKKAMSFKEKEEQEQEELKEKSNTEIYYEIMSLLHGLKSSYEVKKKVLETINRPVKYVTDEYYRKGQINEITDFLAKIEALMTTVEDSTDDSSNALKKEESKSDAEKFIDSLHETLLLVTGRHSLFDLFNLSEETKQYAKGRETAFKEILEMIEKYKEKK